MNIERWLLHTQAAQYTRGIHTLHLPRIVREAADVAQIQIQSTNSSLTTFKILCLNKPTLKNIRCEGSKPKANLKIIRFDSIDQTNVRHTTTGNTHARTHGFAGSGGGDGNGLVEDEEV